MFLYYGLFAAYSYTKYMFGSIREGEKCTINVDIYPFIKNSKLYIFDTHIHHWLWSSCILLLLLYIKTNSLYKYNMIKFMIGFCIVMIFHGLLYKDAFVFDHL